MTLDSVAVVGIVVPMIGAIFSVGMLFQRAKRTESDVADVRRAIHTLRNEVMKTLLDIQLDVARLSSSREMAE